MGIGQTMTSLSLMYPVAKSKFLRQSIISDIVECDGHAN